MALSARDDRAASAQWIDQQSALAEVVAEGARSPWVALDTEFHRERTYFPRLALVQVATDGGVWLLDPLALDLEPLAAWFEESGPELVLHAAEQDLEVLERATGSRPRRVFDTQVAGGFLGLAHASLGALLERFLGVHISKAERTSDWLVRPLDPAQVRYAANDVRFLLALRARLVEELRRRGREDWARSEMRRLLARRRREVAPEEAWTRIRECRGLDASSRRVAAGVAAWRERVAQDLDVPVRSVLSDLGVAGVARARPRTLGELRDVRGVDARMPRDRALALLDVVERAEEEPVPVGARGGRGERVVEPEDVPLVLAAQAVVYAVALELELDPTLLGSREDVELLVARREGVLCEGWRYEVVGQALEELLAGRRRVWIERRRLRTTAES